MRDHANLPVVDLAELDDLASLKRGLFETGFFYLRDRPEGFQRLAAIREETARFLAEPLGKKQEHAGLLRGYAALGSEDTQAGFGTGEAGEGDLCEKYTIGTEPAESERAQCPAYYEHPEAQRFFAKNWFPNPSFERAWRDYFNHVAFSASLVMEAVLKALGVSQGAWLEQTHRPVSILRFLNYPETASQSVRMAAHYDDNLLTLLHQSIMTNGMSSLEVMLPGASDWQAVPAHDELFVVNVGEALMYLSEGRAVATKHRVAAVPPAKRSGSARTSIAYFHAPNWDCPLRPVKPREVDSELGQMSATFGLEALQEADGTISYARLQNRAVDGGLVDQEG